MARNNQVGAWGEAAAGSYLERKGFRILDRSYRSRYGEIDLIVRNDRFLVFVEVKLRKNANFARAMEYVDHRKQEKLRITAEFYLAEHPTLLQPRFDVIELYAPWGIQTRSPEIYHLEDAF